MEKRGQQTSAQPIATLIGLIGLFMLGYILLIPPAEREALLGEEFGPGFDKDKVSEDILLDVKPGLVGEQRITVTKDLPTVNLFTTTETEVDGIVTSLSVRRNAFFNRKENITFNLINLNEIEKLELFFFVTEGEGDLIIKLNGNKIFENKVVSRLVLELPLSKLIEGNNVIEFSVSDVGAKFWGENIYVLNDLKLIKKFRVENKEAEVIFNIEEGDFNNLDNAFLNYFLFCGSKVRGNLRVSINDNNVFSGVPRCNVYSGISVPISDLKKGRNVVKFSIDRGDYVIDKLEVELTLKSKSVTSYSFNLDSSEFNDVIDGDKNVILEISVSDFDRGDFLDIFVNNVVLNIDSELFIEDISDVIVRGRNTIKLRAVGSFEVDNLVVRLE